MAYDQYQRELKDLLKFQFNNLECLTTSYSQMHQDLFVLSILNGQKNGTYLEIGAHHPIEVNNTYLLESLFSWKGVSVEFDHSWISLWNEKRTNPIIHADAINLDYEKILSQFNLGSVIDYLSVDIDPPDGTLAALLKIPHNKFRFKVITFEHSANISEGIRARQSSRTFLSQLGYELIIPDVSNEELSGVEKGRLYPIEDWWVDKRLVDPVAFEKLKIEHGKYTASRFTVYDSSYGDPR